METNNLSNRYTLFVFLIWQNYHDLIHLQDYKIFLKLCVHLSIYIYIYIYIFCFLYYSGVNIYIYSLHQDYIKLYIIVYIKKYVRAIRITSTFLGFAQLFL